MFAFVSWFLGALGRSPIGQLLFTLIVEKLTGMIQASIAREKARRKALDDAKKSVEELKNAKTKEEVEKASNAAADGF